MNAFCIIPESGPALSGNLDSCLWIIVLKLFAHVHITGIPKLTDLDTEVAGCGSGLLFECTEGHRPCTRQQTDQSQSEGVLKKRIQRPV